MSEWQPGDLALCVTGGRISYTPALVPVDWPRKGRIYRVAKFGVRIFADGPDFALWLEDGPDAGQGERVWKALRFRKIRPHTPDAEDAETIALLTGKPAFVLEPQP